MDASDFGSDNDGNFSSGTTLGADSSNLADWGFDSPDFGGFGTTGGFGSLSNSFSSPDNSGFSLNSLFDNTNSNFSSGSVLGVDSSSMADFGFDAPSFSDTFGTIGGLGEMDNPISFNFDTNDGKNGKKGFNPFNIITTLLTLNPATAPLGMALGLGNSINNAVQSGNMSGLAGSAIGALTGNSTLGNIAGMGINGMNGGNVSGQAGGIAGGMLGNAIAGPIGSMFGSDIGSSLTGGMTSDGPPAGVANGSGPNIDPGMILGGLGSLYLANQAGNDAKTMANNQTPAAAQGIAGAAGVPTLESMFGPDSSYAQNMRKQLERRDAAKGRRSQYGPREVELQAKLAEMASRAAPDYIRATSAAQTAGTTSQQTVNTAQRAADEQRLKILYTLGRESGLFKELGGLFKQQPTQQLPTNYLTNDWMQPAGNTDFGVQNIDTNYQPSNNFYDYGQDL